MNDDNQLRDSSLVPLPDIETCNETNTAAERLGRPRGKICRFLGKVTNGVMKKISRSNLKDSRSRDPVLPNVDHEGISLVPNIETQDTPLKDSRSRDPVLSNIVHEVTSSVPNTEAQDTPLKDSRSCDPVLPKVDCEGASSVPNTEVQDSSLGMEQYAYIRAALQDADKAANDMNLLPGPMKSGTRITQNAPADIEDAYNNYLQPLKIFDTVIGALANVHPYAKIALGGLSGAAKIVLAQADRDEAMLSLLKKLKDVYDFISDSERLRQISSMRTVLGNISQQTLECAHFIRDYSKIKSFWKRTGKNLVRETDDAIQRYSKVLDDLMDNFQTQVALDTNISVHRIVETMQLSGITYAEGAGLITEKQCLFETRRRTLSEITDWANSTGGDGSRVLWLSGPAGTGKSAIAHTIAKWFKDAGGLGSCYCFDRHQKADNRHQKIFSTIARDLAECDPEIKRALAEAVEDESLKKTLDIIQQWDELLMKPLGKVSDITTRPIVIVIDALDESGGVEIRDSILRVLAGELGNQPITTLPANLRIIVTSRPLPDIDDQLGNAPHIRKMSMDAIPSTETKDDISAYISNKLGKLSEFRDEQIAALAEKADGLFEWARLAWRYIVDAPLGLSRIDRFKTLMARDPRERKDLLYDMYNFILAELMPQDKYTASEYQCALARFRSVMGQILGVAKPLPLASLQGMRDRFPDRNGHCKVELVVKAMGPLLSGTTNLQFPIRPLHASFSEFLMDPESSCKQDFRIDVSKVQRDLAFASLQAMKDLHFNICGFKSSYIPNYEDPELQERVEKFSPYLSYSCQFWALHVQGAQFDPQLADEIKSFLNHERLLFWLEVLSFINAINGAVASLEIITQWLENRSEYEGVLPTAKDVKIFIETFRGIILHSTPHLYISALPFSPVNSEISKKLAVKFPKTLSLTSGRALDWIAIQIEHGYTAGVESVSFSPDGTRVVTGLSDGTLLLWDTSTGRPLIAPMREHTGRILSVTFSPDGTRIASGSADSTVRLWDAGTGEPLGEPLLGHTDWVSSVSFSPDGTRIASGSDDHTVRLWDAGTGKPVSTTLSGHTQSVSSVSFSPDGTRIVSGSDDNTVRLWDVRTAQPVGEPLRGHTDRIRSVTFSPDGTRIASGSDDRTVRLWDAGTSEPLGEPLRGHTNSVSSVSFSPDGTRITSGSDDNTVRLWDVRMAQPVGEPLEGHTSSVSSVHFSPDGTRIASGSKDGTVRLWDASVSQADQFIRFSSDPTHALYNPAELIGGSRHTSFLLGVDGWMIGPDRQLLFWVPPGLREPFYTPRTALILSKEKAELDLSRMEHGKRWSKCRDENRTEG